MTLTLPYVGGIQQIFKIEFREAEWEGGCRMGSSGLAWGSIARHLNTTSSQAECILTDRLSAYQEVLCRTESLVWRLIERTSE
jgi:hypothetical protein